MRQLFCVVLLAGCSQQTTNPPPNSPTPVSVKSELRAVSAQGGLLPWVAFDHSSICSNQAIRHLEVIRASNGRTAWSSERWGQLVGELPDGGLLATNLDTEERKGLVVALLSRGDGAVRWSCEASVPNNTTSAMWTFTEHGAVGQLVAIYTKGGAAHPPPPTLPAVELVISATGCTLEERPGAELRPVGIGDSSPKEWTTDDIILRIGPPAPAGPYTNLTSGPPVHLTATRSGTELWTRELSMPPQVPCLAP